MSNDFFDYAGQAESAHPPRAILADLNSEDWERFIGYAARRRYPPGAVVVQAGEAAATLGFVALGSVEVILTAPARPARGRPARRGEGEVFGLLSFLDGAASAATVIVAADAPAEVLLLSPEALQQLAAWEPRIAMALLRDLGAHVAARLRQLQPGD